MDAEVSDKMRLEGMSNNGEDNLSTNCVICLLIDLEVYDPLKGLHPELQSGGSYHAYWIPVSSSHDGRSW